MLTRNYKIGKIAPINLFFILAISRIIVSLTYVQSVSVGKIKTDLLYSILLGFGITLLFSLPVIFCVKKNKNPIDIKWVSLAYSVHFIMLAGLNITRFAYFASTKLNPNMASVFFVVLVSVGAVYAAYLGIEPLSRMSSVVFVAIVVGFAIILFFNIDGLEFINYAPYHSVETKEVITNSFVFVSNTAEIPIFLCLIQRVNGKAYKSLIWAISVAFLVLFLLMTFVIGVMGTFTEYQSFPIFTLSQLAVIGNFRRFDSVFATIWIVAIFVKSAVLIYCSSMCIGKTFAKTKHKWTTLVSGLLVCSFGIFQVSKFITSWKEMNKWMIFIPLLIFGVVIPLLSIVFKKRNYGDELIEKF